MELFIKIRPQYYFGEPNNEAWSWLQCWVIYILTGDIERQSSVSKNENVKVITTIATKSLRGKNTNFLHKLYEPSRER